MTVAEKVASIPHPFYPTSLILPHYRLSEWSTLSILAIFFGAVGSVLLVAYLLISRKPYPFSTRLLFLWFLLCGFIHSVVEGYFAYNNKEIAGMTTFLGDLWKEYAQGDSRYMFSDPFVVIMEGITAVSVGFVYFRIAPCEREDHTPEYSSRAFRSCGDPAPSSPHGQSTETTPSVTFSNSSFPPAKCTAMCFTTQQPCGRGHLTARRIHSISGSTSLLLTDSGLSSP